MNEEIDGLVNELALKEARAAEACGLKAIKECTDLSSVGNVVISAQN